MNGWQRLWFVLTCLLLVGGVMFSWLESRRYGKSPSGHDYRRSLEADFANPQCKVYTERLLIELREPPFNSNKSNCWHLYTSRHYSKFKDTLPFTLVTYERGREADKWDQFLTMLTLLGILSAILSALAYFAGWVVAWIRRGFVKTA